MKKMLEELWDDYFLEKCAEIDTEEERSLAKKAIAIHEKARRLLNEEQRDAMEQYVDVLYSVQACFAKKHFCRGASLRLPSF